MAKQLNINMSIQADTAQAKKALSDLNKTLDSILSHRTITIEDQSFQQAKQAALDLKHHLDAAVNVNTGKLDLSKFSASLNKSGQNLQGLYTNLSKIGPEGQSAFLSLSQSIAKADASAITLGGRLGNLMTVLKNTARWQISSSILHGFMGAIQSAYGYAQDLNESLNNIRIVTGQSEDQMARFAREANNAAKALSTTTTQYTNASLIYYQQGLSDEEVKARTDATIKLANVSRQSAEEVSDQMTAVWNNFAEGSDNLEYYIDVMAKLGATTASSTQEISTGLEKFAAVAKTVGLSYEYATAALATVTAKTRQSADVVGTAFKTLFARLQDLELGDALEDGTTLGKYSAALNAVGVNIKDVNGEVKKMDQILDELGSKWDTIAKDQQIALAQTVAGTRQYTQLIALMDNWDFMQENLNTVANAEGTLQEQADIYAESWEAARDRVRAAAEEIYSQLVNDKAFIGILNGLEKIIEFIGNTINSLGGLKGILFAIGSIFMNVYAKEIPSVFQNIVSNIKVLTGAAEKQRQSMISNMSQIVQSMQKNSDNKDLEAQLLGMQKVSGMYDELARKRNSLSKAEIEEYEQKIKNVEMYSQIAEAIGKEIDKLNEEAIVLKHSASENLQENGNLGSINWDDLDDKNQSFVIDNFIPDLKETNKEIEKAKKGIEETKDEADSPIGQAWRDYFKELQKDAEKLRKSVSGKNLLTGFEKAARQVGQMHQALDVVTSKTEIWSNELKDIDDDSEAINKIKQEMIAYRDELKEAGIGTQQIDEALDKIGEDGAGLENVINAFKQVGDLDPDSKIAQAEKNLKQYKQALENLGVNSTTLDELEQKWQRNEITTKEYTAALKELETQQQGTLQHQVKAGEVIGKVGSAFMALGQLISQIKGIISTFNDETATTGDKILSLITGFGMLIPAVSSFIGALKALGTTLNLTFWQITLIAAGIAAMIGIIALIVTRETDAEKKAKKAKKAAEDLAKQEQEAKKQADALRQSIDKYDSAVDKLKQCVRGTKEWKEALKETNDAALEIMKHIGNINLAVLGYENVSDLYNTDNGYIEFNDGVLEKLNDFQDRQVQTAEMASSMGQLRKTQTQVDADLEDYAWSEIAPWLWRKESETGQHDVTGDEVEKLIKENFEPLKDGTITLKEIFEEVGLTIDASEEEIDIWQKKIIDMAKTAGEADDKLKLITQLQVEQLLGDEYSSAEKNYATSETAAYQKAREDYWKQLLTSNEDKRIWTGKYKESGEKEYEYSTGISQTSDADNKIYKAALEGLQKAGYNFAEYYDNAVQGTDTERVLAFLNNGEVVKYTAQQVAAMIAASEALEHMEISAKDASQMLDGLSGEGADFTNTLFNFKTDDNGNKIFDFTDFFKNISIKDLQDIIAEGEFNQENFEELTGISAEKLESFAKALNMTTDELIELISTDAQAISESISPETWAGGAGDLANVSYSKLAESGMSAQEITKLSNDIFDTKKQLEDFGLSMNSLREVTKDLDPKQLSDFYSELNKINFTDENATEQIQKLLNTYNLSGEAAESFVAEVDTLPKTFNIATADIEASKAALDKIIGKEGLKSGDIIKDEDLKTLQEAGINVDQYFTKMSDGSYVLTGKAEDFNNAVNRINLNKLKDQVLDFQKNQNKVVGSRSSLFQDFYNKNLLNTDVVLRGDKTTESQFLSNGGQTSLGQDRLEYLSNFQDGTFNFNQEQSELLSKYQSASDKNIFMNNLSEEDFQMIANMTDIAIQKQKELQAEYFSSANSLQQLKDMSLAIGEYDYNAYAEGLIAVASQYDNATEEVIAYQEALKTGDIEQIRAAESALELAARIGEASKKYGLEAENVETQAKLIAEEYGIAAEAAADLAIKNQRMNKGVAALNKDFSTWNKTLTTADHKSVDYAETLNLANDALANLTGAIDGASVPLDFLDNTTEDGARHLELLSKAADGDTEAINQLGNELAYAQINALEFNEAITSLLDEDGNKIGDIINVAEFESAKDIVLQGIDTLHSKLGELEDGAEVGDILGRNWVDSLNNMAIATGMSVDQMKAYLNQLGVQTDVTTTPVTQKTRVPVYTTEETVEVIDPGGATNPENPADIRPATYRKTSKTWQTGTEEVEETIDVAQINVGDSVGTPPSITYRGAKSSGGVSPSSTSNGKSGGGGGGGSKAKEPTKKETKNPTDEKDRYHVIKEQLDDLSQAYDRVNQAKDRAFGANKLAGIKAEQKILQEQIDAQDEYLKQIKEMGKYDVNNLQYGKEKGFAIDGEWYATGGLSYYGLDAQFDENGVLTNYDQIVDAAVAKYNEAVAYYNSLTGEQQENDKTLEFAEKQYSSFMELLKQYEDTNNLLQDEVDERQKLFYQWQDNNYEALSYEIELKLKVNDNELKWLDYQLKKIGDSVYKTSEAIANLFSTKGSSQAGVAVQTMNDLLDHMNKLDEAYAEGKISETEYFEGLEKTRDGMYQQLEALMAIDKEMEEYYSNTLSKINEELDKFTNRMRHNIDVVNHMKDILELSGRGQDYEAMGSLLNANMQQTGDVYQTSKERYDMMLAQEKEAEAKLQDAMKKGGKEEQEIAQKNYDAAIAARQEAENTMYEDWKAHLEACNAVLENELNKTKKAWDDIYTDGQGWEYLEQVMDLAQRIGDKYLTKTNQLYETNKMLRTIQQDMDKTTNKAAQQKLNNFAKEIQNLQQIGKLTKDNLEIAKAQYEVLKAEIALEEAQNAKSTVRLQRDNEGNYGYVYTADQDKVEDAKQQLEDRRNDLYNLALEQENKNAQDILQINKEKNEALDALNRQYYIDKTITEEEYNRRSQEIQQKYNDLLLAATKDHLVAREILNQESITGENDSWTAEYADLVTKGYAYIDAQDEFWKLGFGSITSARGEWFNQESPEWDKFYKSIMGGAVVTQEKWSGELITMQKNTKTAMDAFNEAVGVDEKSGVRGTLLDLDTKLGNVTTATDDLKGKLTGEDGLIVQLGKEASGVQASTTEWGKYYDKLKLPGGVISAVDEAIIKINALITAASTNASATYTTKYVREGSPEPDMRDQTATYTTTYKTSGNPSGNGGGSGSGNTSSGSGQKTWKKYVYKQKDSTYHEVYNHYTDGSESLVRTEEHDFDGKKCTKCGYKKSGGGCFTGDSQVIMGDYTFKELKDVKINDYVLAYNEEKKYFEIEQVLDIYIQHKAYSVVDIYLSNGEILKMTPSHPLLTSQGWKSLDIERALFEHGLETTLLKIGDIILGFGTFGKVEKIIYEDMSKDIEVYTLMVNNCHTFIVNNMIVHNMPAPNVITKYASGGYTGEWIGGSQLDNGKLAILHQKELVLNEDDTKNMLQTVSLVRELSQILDLQAGVASLSTGISPASIWDNTQTLEQMVTIHAEFPNAVNHTEIEEAFNTLVNRASQYAGRPRK